MRSADTLFRYVLTTQDNAPSGGIQEAGQHVHQFRLAVAIDSGHRENFPFPNGKGDFIQTFEAGPFFQRNPS